MSNKTRYCKYCGNEIDNITKVCSSCGKGSFFRRHGFSVSTIIFALLFMFSCVVSVILIIQNVSLKANIETLKTSNDELKAAVSSLSEEFDDLTKSYDALESKYEENTKGMIDAIYELNDYQNDFAYVTQVGEKYHKRSCFIVSDIKTLHCNTIIELKQQGYEACLLCYE